MAMMSVHLAEVGVREAARTLRRPLDAGTVAGLSYCETVTVTRLGGTLLPSPRPGAVGLIAAWEDDAALDGFLASHPFAGTLAGGWHVRLQPLRVSGAWPRIPDLPSSPLAAEDSEPVAALTLGRPRLRRLLPFLRAASRAEAEAAAAPAVIASAGLGRPPGLVSTFSLWSSLAAMREYAYGGAGAHQAAVGGDRSRPFHHESAFLRLRPYGSRGSWDGTAPLQR